MNTGMQHLHARRRIFSHLEAFPSEDALKRSLDYTMFFVGIAQPLALIPQIYDIYAARQVAGVSAITFAAFGLCNVLWTVYGLVHKEPPIWISGILFVFLYAIIVTGIVLYS